MTICEEQLKEQQGAKKKCRWRLWLFIVFGLVGIFGWFYCEETYSIEVRTVNYSQGDGFLKKPIKIVMVSDLHWTPSQGWYAQELVDLVNAQDPDIICLLGDYAHGHEAKDSMSAENALPYFSQLHARYGVFAVQGNHDVWYGWDDWKKVLQKAGIRVLENESCVLTMPQVGSIQLSGVKDDSSFWIKETDIPKRQGKGNIYHLLLSHSPDVHPVVPPGEVDMIISGHTHGGQVCLPNGQAVKSGSKYEIFYTYPWDEKGGNSLLLTKGVGCSILPIRLFCHPEIVVLTLK